MNALMEIVNSQVGAWTPYELLIRAAQVCLLIAGLLAALRDRVIAFTCREVYLATVIAMTTAGAGFVFLGLLVHIG